MIANQISLPRHDVSGLGQVFTPPPIVECMRTLVSNKGRVLEPSCGDGAFLKHFPQAVGIELDAHHAPASAQIMDFFAYPESELFDTIIGNPPYVRHQDMASTTRSLIKRSVLDLRANLYLLFIEKCLRHLRPGGELIFVTPRDFLLATSAKRLNQQMLALGTITHFIDLGDLHLFNMGSSATPNCAIWRFERDNFSRQVRYVALSRNDGAAALKHPAWQERKLIEAAGCLRFTQHDYPLRLTDIAFVKVGAVSGADDLYTSEQHGTRSFVCSTTRGDGQTRSMIWCPPEPSAGPKSCPPAILLPHKARLLARKIRPFDEHNWWQWGRGYHQSKAPRLYVNLKTRRNQPFFVHPCRHYDGSVLAIFPRRLDVDMVQFAAALNAVNWADLGFVCDGRFLFTQRSLEQTPLPERLSIFAPLY